MRADVLQESQTKQEKGNTMRNLILVSLLIGTVGCMNAAAASAQRGNEITVVMSEVEGSKEGALTVHADNVRFERLAIAILDALNKYDGEKLTYSFGKEVGKQVVSLHIDKERARSAIHRELLKCGRCEISVERRAGVEHAMFTPKQEKNAVQKAPVLRGVTSADEEIKMMEATLRSFLTYMNEGDIGAAKSIVRQRGAETDPTKGWSNGMWTLHKKRPKAELDKLVISRGRVEDGDPKTGRLSAKVYREGAARSKNRTPAFAFIDGVCYLIKF